MLPTQILIALLLSFVPTPATVKYDLSGTGADRLTAPSLKVFNVLNAVPVTFTIHARTDHHPTSGTAIKVWITPGSDESQAVRESCRQSPKCTDTAPDQGVLQQLFQRALNRALWANQNGFGHYLITRCGDVPATRNFGELHLAAKVAVAVDPLYQYTIANYSAGKVTQTQYHLRINGGDYPNPQFLASTKVHREGLEYIWGLCQANKLDRIIFVTQLPVTALQDDTKSPMVGKF